MGWQRKQWSSWIFRRLLQRYIEFAFVNYDDYFACDRNKCCFSGLFRTIYGNSQSKIDLIPVDYTINASLVLGWYVGTRKLELPEVIHSTSGDVNPISLQEYTDIINDRVRMHPSRAMVWIPSAKIRNGLRHIVYFYLFQIFPTMIWYWPEKLLGLGIRHHTYVNYISIAFLSSLMISSESFEFLSSKLTNFFLSIKTGVWSLCAFSTKVHEHFIFS